MVSKYTFCSIALLAFVLQSRVAAYTGFQDDEDCNLQLLRSLHSFRSPEFTTINDQRSFEDVFDEHRRLIFPQINGKFKIGWGFNATIGHHHIRPISKSYVINVRVGTLHIPRYIRIFIGWIKFIHGLTDKAKMFTLRLLVRMLRLFLEWPLHRPHIIIEADHAIVLRYLLHILFPEWPDYQLNVVFEGYPSVSIVIVYKRIFRLTFPEWPEFEVNTIFDGTDSLVVVLQRLAGLLFPQWPNANYIFQGSPTVTDVLKKLLKILLPSFTLHTFLGNSNSPFTILEKVLITQFPGWPNENTVLIGWTFIKLLRPYYIKVRPQLPHYGSIGTGDQQILDKLTDALKTEMTKAITSSPIDVRNTFISSFGGHVPEVANKLGQLFDAIFGDVYGRPSRVPDIDFHGDKFKGTLIIGGLPIESNMWNQMFPEVPMPIEPTPPVATPRPTPPPIGSDKHGGLNLYIIWSTNPLPVLQSGGPSDNSFCLKPSENYTPIPRQAWLQKMNPADEVVRLLFIGEPGFDTSILNNDFAVPEAINKLLFQWPKYKDIFTMNGKIPVIYVIKSFLPALLYNWPKTIVMSLIEGTNSLRVILQRIFDNIFSTWRPFTSGSVTPVHLIFKRLLLRMLPQIPKSETKLLFEGSMTSNDISHRLLKSLFPRWPHLDLGYIPKHIDPEIIRNLLSMIYNWPKTQEMLKVYNMEGLYQAIKKLSQIVMPKLPQHEIDMMSNNKMSLSLLISRFIYILNPEHVIALDVNPQDQPTITVPYWAFDILFSNWPNYDVHVGDKDLQTSPAFRRCLNWLRSQITAILHKASCSDHTVYAWVGELASALLEYSIETLPAVCAKKD